MKSNDKTLYPAVKLSLFLLMKLAASNCSRRESSSSNILHLILEAKLIQDAIDSVLNELICTSIEVLFLYPVHFRILWCFLQYFWKLCFREWVEFFNGKQTSLFGLALGEQQVDIIHEFAACEENVLALFDLIEIFVS